jgi:hypothetical protein
MLPFRSAVRRRFLILVVGVVLVAAGLGGLWFTARFGERLQSRDRRLQYRPRQPLETSAYKLIFENPTAWKANASLEEIAEYWRRSGYRHVERLDRDLAGGNLSAAARIPVYLLKADLLLYEGEARPAFEILEQARALAEADDALAEKYLFTIVYCQGLTGLRIGENDNCILCRGESSCILPISPAAVHTNAKGSRLAVQHFSEYLRQFPNDLEVRWLLNLAHMTLGEYPDKVAPQFLVPLDHWRHCAFDIGKFRDVGHLVGVNRFNMAGGAIMDDFDNDGLLDLVTTSSDPTSPMAYYRNRGDGTFEERAAAAGLAGQLGGLYCVQTDYNNDGLLDVFVCRGAWLAAPVRPSLLRNNGDGTFTDVTREAGLLDPVNSICAAWADYDNDGFLDLFLCCERQPNHLYRNKGDGTFEEVAARAGVQGGGHHCKGAAWIDFDNDGFPDLFLNNLRGAAQLFRNNRDGTFTEVTTAMGINGPVEAFSCWAWDYDNDGWLDLFATCSDGNIEDAVKGLLGKPHRRRRNTGG